MPEQLAIIISLAMMYICGRMVEQIKQNQRAEHRRRRVYEFTKNRNWYK